MHKYNLLFFFFLNPCMIFFLFIYFFLIFNITTFTTFLNRRLVGGIFNGIILKYQWKENTINTKENARYKKSRFILAGAGLGTFLYCQHFSMSLAIFFKKKRRNLDKIKRFLLINKWRDKMIFSMYLMSFLLFHIVFSN